MCCLTETKIKDHGSLLNEYNFTDLIQATTEGFSGGMAILWCGNQLKVDPINGSLLPMKYMIPSKYLPLTPLVLSLIYASTKYSCHQSLWLNLEEIATTHNMAWLLCGDFNEVSTGSDKFGGVPVNINRLLLSINV